MEGGSRYKKGLWTVEEDKTLVEYIRVHGKGRWNRVAKMTGTQESCESVSCIGKNRIANGLDQNPDLIQPFRLEWMQNKYVLKL
ncbi:hypothetical protein HHK36_024937 [Tetracentron sinense]|uniref:Uncharacterized protein n=1 Tax=Tetracentron sinense TaxID=13715 RepID=A0A834YRP4_TETSI|nr:hypothetical protein HHK36_024937 [Tetracentron sinense]